MKAISHQDQVIHLRLCVSILLRVSLLDMLGFKLDMPRREDSMKEKTRPIYLDMQVRTLSISILKSWLTE